jgi:transposase-like protein
MDQSQTDLTRPPELARVLPELAGVVALLAACQPRLRHLGVWTIRLDVSEGGDPTLAALVGAAPKGSIRSFVTSHGAKSWHSKGVTVPMAEPGQVWLSGAKLQKYLDERVSSLPRYRGVTLYADDFGTEPGDVIARMNGQAYVPSLVGSVVPGDSVSQAGRKNGPASMQPRGHTTRAIPENLGYALPSPSAAAELLRKKSELAEAEEALANLRRAHADFRMTPKVTPSAYHPEEFFRRLDALNGHFRSLGLEPLGEGMTPSRVPSLLR